MEEGAGCREGHAGWLGAQPISCRSPPGNQPLTRERLGRTRVWGLQFRGGGDTGLLGLGQPWLGAGTLSPEGVAPLHLEPEQEGERFSVWGLWRKAGGEGLGQGGPCPPPSSPLLSPPSTALPLCESHCRSQHSCFGPGLLAGGLGKWGLGPRLWVQRAEQETAEPVTWVTGGEGQRWGAEVASRLLGGCWKETASDPHCGLGLGLSPSLVKNFKTQLFWL